MLQLLILVITLAIAAFYIATLQRTLKAISPLNRMLRPGILWLLLVPLFNIYFHLYVVIKLSASISAEILNRSGQLKTSRPTYAAGMIASVGFIISVTLSAFKLNEHILFTLLGGLCSFAGIVAGIVYWVQVYRYGNVIRSLPQKANVSE